MDPFTTYLLGMILVYSLIPEKPKCESFETKTPCKTKVQQEGVK